MTQSKVRNDPPQKKKKHDKLMEYLRAKREERERVQESSQSLKSKLKSEIDIFNASSTNERPHHLQKLYNCLKSSPVSSTEAERAFSAASMFVTKLRSRLSPSTVDSLCFLNGFFNAK